MDRYIPVALRAWGEVAEYNSRRPHRPTFSCCLVSWQVACMSDIVVITRIIREI
jgi:hypothetical protein